MAAGLCSDPFSVDGTLIEGFASAKSFQPVTLELPAPGVTATPPAKSQAPVTRYDGGQFFADVESRGVVPHVPPVATPRPSATAAAKVEARGRMQTRAGGEGYRLSPKCREEIEEGFGWIKTIAGLGRSRVVGRWKLSQLLEMGAAAFDLVRLRKLSPA